MPAGGGEGDGSTTPGEGDSSATSDEEEQLDELDEGESKNNDLRGDQKIILENNAIVGEAVYYDLYDVTDGSEKLDKNELYQGGIDLTLGDEVRKSYKIVTYDMSYGVKSTKATYNINLYSSKHNIEIVDKAKDGTKRTATSVSEEGAEATVMAGKSDSDYFTSWTVSLLDGKGNVIAGKEDITDEILGDSKAKNETAVFTLPVVDKNNYPEGYGLRFTANYKDKINECLELIGMQDKRKLTPRELSGGQQQRVAIARALVFDPDILFLDEPIGNLDSKSGTKIMELFRRINWKYNKTIVQVTHSEEAARYGSRLVRIVDGEIAKMEEIKNQIKSA